MAKKARKHWWFVPQNKGPHLASNIDGTVLDSIYYVLDTKAFTYTIFYSNLHPILFFVFRWLGASAQLDAQQGAPVKNWRRGAPTTASAKETARGLPTGRKRRRKPGDANVRENATRKCVAARRTTSCVIASSAHNVSQKTVSVGTRYTLMGPQRGEGGFSHAILLVLKYVFLLFLIDWSQIMKWFMSHHWGLTPKILCTHPWPLRIGD